MGRSIFNICYSCRSCWFVLSRRYFPYKIFFIIALVVIFLVTTLWLLIFNSDKSRVIEYGLIFDDKGVCYVEYGSKKTLEWHQCEGVVVTSARDYPRVITIKSKNKDDIAFGYYVFSRKQREAIFRHISAFLPS